MLCRFVLLLLIGLSLLGLLLTGRALSPAADPPAVAAAIKVPPGFSVEKVAGPPLIEHPVMAGFDERGRLFVADSAGLNLKAKELQKDLPNRIRLLEDSDGDGVFDRSTIFADKMTFPMGALWYKGALYSCSPPSVWRLEDRRGTGVAQRRHELVTKFGFSGNAADIHGPFLAPDGWLYWTDGRHGHQIDTPLGKKLQGKAARIFRCRPDGRDVEVVCGGGMDDPVELAFTAEGEAFATVDIFVSRPSRSDAIIHCIEGGVFPYHDVYKEFKSTGDLLPPVTHLGWVAPSGLMCYRGTALGNEYRDNLFSTLFNTHKIQRHVLERAGATFRAKNEDFLVSTHPDFHPTDVLEDADGSLLVLDTGGWFRIGCPTAQIAKPDVKGAIYRIRRQDAPKSDDPWGKKLAWDRLAPRELAALLADVRWAVRDRAIEQLAEKGNAALSVLQEVLTPPASPSSTGGVQSRRNAVWALTRIESAAARAAVRRAFKDSDPSVRNAAVHSAGLLRDSGALAMLSELVVKDSSLAVRREAATGLGRLQRPGAVPALLEALRTPGDRFLEHALIFALIQLADREATLKGLADASPGVRRGALIALDQMDGGNLTRELVVPLLDADDLALEQAALNIVISRPAWAPQLVDLLRGWVRRGDLSEKRQDTLRAALGAFCKDAAVVDLVARAVNQDRTPIAMRLLLLETMAQAPLDKLPPAWLTELGRSIDSGEERVARQGVAAVGRRGIKDFDGLLQRLALDGQRSAELRVAALEVVTARLARLEPPLFAFLAARLDPSLPPLDRLAAASALGQARLSAAQLETLTRAIATAGALEMPHLVGPFEHSKDPEVGKKLLAALDKAPGLTSLSPTILRRTLQDYPEEVRNAAGPFLERLELDLEKTKKRLAELAPVLLGGDPGRGKNVFRSTRAACASCHAIKGEGGQIGPDLSTIGGIRTPRDLLEAIVFPSASYVRGFEPYSVATKDGKLYQGILKRDSDQAIYLVTGERLEFRIPRSAIETIDPAKVSIMPQGLDTQLSRQEMADLIAYLGSLK